MSVFPGSHVHDITTNSVQSGYMCFGYISRTALVAIHVEMGLSMTFYQCRHLLVSLVIQCYYFGNDFYTCILCSSFTSISPRQTSEEPKTKETEKHFHLWYRRCGVLPLYVWHVASGIIRPSVDGLCRDGPSEISRDPRTKRL